MRKAITKSVGGTVHVCHRPLSFCAFALCLFSLLLSAPFVGIVADVAHADERPERGQRPKLPEPLGYVSDHGNVVDTDWRARIRSVCQDLERKTGVEMVVVTVPSLAPFANAQRYAETLYGNWKIGSASYEYGVMVLLSVQERQGALMVGKRMVPIVTDEVVKQIWSDALESSLRTGHFSEGLYQTVVRIAAISQDIRVGPPQRTHMRGVGTIITILTIIAAIIAFWGISRPDLRHPFAKIRRGMFWSSGQGGMGGSFGGFGGTTGKDELS
ncbi:MAG: TPM domain-containing protein [Nitrospiraceae bacterium]